MESSSHTGPISGRCGQVSQVTYLVAQEMSLDLGGGGVGAETPHHGDQLCGRDLPVPLAVVQRETLLKVWKGPQTHGHK